MTEALFGFIGVIVGALVPWLQSSLESRRTRERDAQYLAIRVACILDKFVEDCAAVAADEGQENQHGITEAATKTPEVQYPQDVDWRSINPELMYSLLSFQNEVRAAEAATAAAWDWEDVPEFTHYFETRGGQYGECGLKAAKLGQELRRMFKIPANNYPDRWDPVKVIGKEQIARTKRQRERMKLIMDNLADDVLPGDRGEVSPGEGETR
jgi:hypothetical protein